MISRGRSIERPFSFFREQNFDARRQRSATVRFKNGCNQNTTYATNQYGSIRFYVEEIGTLT
jgi:hypothetical protein